MNKPRVLSLDTMSGRRLSLKMLIMTRGRICAGAEAQVGQLLQRRGAVWAARHAVRGAAADREGARAAQPPLLVRAAALPQKQCSGM